jgi:hypothetical protein
MTAPSDPEPSNKSGVNASALMVGIGTLLMGVGALIAALR